MQYMKLKSRKWLGRLKSWNRIINNSRKVSRSTLKITKRGQACTAIELMRSVESRILWIRSLQNPISTVKEDRETLVDPKWEILCSTRWVSKTIVAYLFFTLLWINIDVRPICHFEIRPWWHFNKLLPRREKLTRALTPMKNLRCRKHLHQKWSNTTVQFKTLWSRLWICNLK